MENQYLRQNCHQMWSIQQPLQQSMIDSSEQFSDKNQSMDNDEQRTESQWSILPSHIHKLWQQMFRLNHYRCQISNERRNIQHGLLLALEQYRDRISKEIITLSEILRPMEQPHQHSRLFQRPRSKTQEELIRLNRLLQLTSNFLKQLNRFNHFLFHSKEKNRKHTCVCKSYDDKFASK